MFVDCTKGPTSTKGAAAHRLFSRDLEEDVVHERVESNALVLVAADPSAKALTAAAKAKTETDRCERIVSGIRILQFKADATKQEACGKNKTHLATNDTWGPWAHRPH